MPAPALPVPWGERPKPTTSRQAAQPERQRVTATGGRSNDFTATPRE